MVFKDIKEWYLVTDVERTVLLVVDDETTVCRALSRMLRNYVDEIITATNPAEAESVLAMGKVTHLICDHWFGPGQPLGLDLVARWKKDYTSITRAVVLTGTDVTQLKTQPGVHQIMAKTVEPKELAIALDLSISK